MCSAGRSKARAADETLAPSPPTDLPLALLTLPLTLSPHPGQPFIPNQASSRRCGAT